MARTTTQAGMIDRFTYSPGDGHRYRWQAGREVIVVERIKITRPPIQGRMVFIPTGDTIPVPAARTLTAMSARVDEWRAGHAFPTPGASSEA